MADLRLYEPVQCDRCHEKHVWTPEDDFWDTPLWDGDGKVCDGCFTELVNIKHPNLTWWNYDE